MDSGTRRNMLTYYINFIVVSILGFIVSPVLLNALGPVSFGVWKSLQKFLDFASVADGRASQALKWIVASRAAQGDSAKRADVGAAIIVWLRWLPAASLMAAGVTVAMPLLIRDIPEDVRSVAYIAAAILAANTVLAGLLSIPDSVLVGVNQGYKTMLVNTSVFLGSNLAMVAAAVSGCPLWSLAAIVLLAAVVNAGVTLLLTRKAVSWWGVARPTKSDLRRVFNYSTWTLGWSLVEKLFLASEVVVISVMIGAVAVTQYTFTTYVMQSVLSIAVVSTSAFMPLLGSLLGADEVDAAAQRARSVRHLVTGITVIGGSGVLAFNGAFVTRWVGADQYLGTLLNLLFVVCGLQQALIRMDGQILDVTMRIAPKVIVGALSTAAGIVTGCLGFALTQELTVAIFGVIFWRSVSSVVYPVLVSRSIPGASIPGRATVLAGLLLAGSFALGPLVQSASGLLTTAVVAVWTAISGLAAWYGLIPRDTVRSLVNRGNG